MKNISIGREPDNQIILPPDDRLSRHHATLIIDKKGDITLRDHSANGTTVNGVRIHKSSLHVTRGAEVLFAGIARLDWNQIPRKGKIPVPVYFILPGLLLVSMLLYLFGGRIFSKGPALPQALTPTQIDDKYKSGVGIVAHAYFIKWETDGVGTLFAGYNRALYESRKILDPAVSSSQDELIPFLGTGTGFLVKGKNIQGNLITNRHVSDPAWEFNNEEGQPNSEVQAFIKKINNEVFSFQIKQLRIQPRIGKFKTHTHTLKFLPNETVLQIQKDVSLLEYLNKISSAGLNVERLWHHTGDEVDLALLKTSVIDTSMYHVIDLDNEVDYNRDSIKVGESAYLIGFSGGLLYAYDQYQKAIQRTLQPGLVSQPPNVYSVYYGIDSEPGSSGSPIFNKYGKLIAVHYAGRGNSGYGILAKFIQDLIDLREIESVQ